MMCAPRCIDGRLEFNKVPSLVLQGAFDSAFWSTCKHDGSPTSVLDDSIDNDRIIDRSRPFAERLIQAKRIGQKQLVLS